MKKIQTDDKSYNRYVMRILQNIVSARLEYDDLKKIDKMVQSIIDDRLDEMMHEEVD